MKNLILVVFALGIVLAAAFALFWGRGGASETQQGDAGAGAAEARHAASQVQSEESAATGAPGPAESRQRVEGQPTPSSAPGGALLRVLVQRKDDRAPLEDVEVAVAEIEWGRGGWANQSDFEEMTKRSGKTWRSSAQGEVRVARPGKQGGVVTARKGELYAEGWFQAKQEDPVILLLERDLTLSVRVVDTQQQPVVGVAVGARPEKAEGSDQRMDWISVKSAAPDGIARLAHVQRALQQGGWGRQEPVRALVAYLRVLGVKAETSPLDVDRLPAEPPVLVLPPTGSVLIKAQDGDGQPLQQGGWLALRQQKQRDNQFQNGVQLPAGEASVRVPFVGLGMQLTAEGWIGETQLEPRDFPGPMRAGEEVAVTLEYSRAQPVLTGKALDENGEPLAARELSMWLEVEQHGTDQLSAKTDKEGRFRFVAAKQKAGKKITRLTLRLQGPKEGVFARAGLPRTLVEGPQDLGELKFTDGPLLVGGVVVDELGAPVEEANVSLQWAQAAGRRGRQSGTIDPWQYDFAVRKPGEGRFEVRGELPDGELQLRFQHRDYAGIPPVSFTRGQSDVRAVLVRGGTLAVLALVDDGLKGGELRFALRGAGGDAKEIATQSSRLESAGKIACSWKGLAADTYELLVRTASESSVFKSLSGIVVEPGKPAEDPRLKDLDLRGLVRKIEISAIDAAGAPIDKGGMIAIKDGTSQMLQRGKARLWISRPFLDFTVSIQGFKKKGFTGIASDASVQMEQGYVVRLALKGAEVPAEVRMSASLRPENPSSQGQGPPMDGMHGWPGFEDFFWGNYAERDAKTGEFRIVVNEAAKYRVSVAVIAQNGRFGLERLVPQSIAVADVPGEQRFEIEVGKDELEKALQKARPK